MGNILAVNSSDHSAWRRVAVSPRANGSGGRVVQDPRTDSWLAVAGTWFHGGGFASGEEERLLAEYLAGGAERLARDLEGFFLLLIGDGRLRELIVITDLMGSRHGFVRELEQSAIVSTSLLPLVDLAPATPDPRGCREFLLWGSAFEDRTLFREVRKLSPATIYRFKDGACREKRSYWSMADLDPFRYRDRRAVEELGAAMIDAARRIGRVFPRPICDLTGGYDSRAVVTAFLAAGVDFSTTVSGPPDSPDVRVARSLSPLIRKSHWPIDDRFRLSFDEVRQALSRTGGLYDAVDYARIDRIHRPLSQRFDAGINGSYGELARGYWWEPWRKGLDFRRLARRRFAPPRGASLWPRGEGEWFEELVELLERVDTPLRGAPATMRIDHLYLQLRMQRWQGSIASATDQRWPCLSPFMFRSVMETILQTEASLRVRSLLARRMMAELQPDLAAAPLTSGAPALPLTPRTARLFLPLPISLIETYLLKVFRPPTTEPTRLFDEEHWREFLKPQEMRVGELIDSTRWQSFLTEARFTPPWNRLLTLELALRWPSPLA